jgi:putative flippase GtrA
MNAPPRGRVPRLLRFALVGLAGTVVYYALLWTLVEVAQVAVLASTCVAFLVVAAENYLLHRAWTFASAAPHRRALPSFVALSAAGFGINGAVMAFGVQRQGWHYLWVQAVALALVVSCNLVGTSLIFRRQRAPASRMGRTDDASR